MKNLIGTVSEFLFNITARIDDISNRYKREYVFEEDRIINLIDDLEALTEGISVVCQYYDNIDIMELKEKLSYMEDAFESKDPEVFIDTILYELKPLLSYWSETITKE